MENFVELEKDQLKEIDGGGLGSWAWRLIRDGIAYDIAKEVAGAIADAGGGLTPQQSADYYRYRGM